jgi:hypothetical protein
VLAFAHDETSLAGKVVGIFTANATSMSAPLASRKYAFPVVILNQISPACTSTGALVPLLLEASELNMF